MADFQTQIQESQAQVAAAQSKISELTSRIESARTKMAEGTDIAVDIENASLEDVHAHTDLMNANIAELIMGLDDVTSAFSKDFEDMRSKTGMESFIGIFSKAKADSMREERMRTASIDDKLQDLISKSDVIMKLLESQLAVLNEQKVSVERNLAGTLDEREAVVGELEAVRADILAIDPKIIALEGKISVEQDAAARTKLETELAGLNSKYNEMVQSEQVKLAKSTAIEKGVTDSVDFKIMDFTKTEFPDATFDVVWACESVCHAVDKKDFIKEAYRVLKKGGRLIMSDFFKAKADQEDKNDWINKWGDTWGVPNFATTALFEQGVKETGFQSVEILDYTDKIQKSAKRLYYTSLLGVVPSELYNLFNPNVSRFAKTHYKCGYYQYKGLQEKLWTYNVVFAVK